MSALSEDHIIPVIKPLEWTSFDVIRKLRAHTHLKKIGHAGTLDPLATGLLILCTGKKTKEISLFQSQEKEYSGTITIGKTTPSYDLETPFNSEQPHEHISIKHIEQVIQGFIGWIDQKPPRFSAIKIKGQRSYKKARKGEEVTMTSKKVFIKMFEVVDFSPPTLSFRLICSKGTYVRSLAHDIGQALEVGAYLSLLERTRIGQFHINNAYTIDQVLKMFPRSPLKK